jgi:hypothetical protein
LPSVFGSPLGGRDFIAETKKGSEMLEEKQSANSGAEEKMDRRFASWLDPGCTFVSEEAQRAYVARVTRLTAAMRLLSVASGAPARAVWPV